MTNIIIEELRQKPVAKMKVEIVERKGTGHPDTICDAIMEEVSRALCREYIANFGRVLHFNADKALLVAGRTEPKFGGGRVLEPMRLIFGDRATDEFEGKKIDVGAIVESVSGKWIRKNLRFVDPDKHIILQNELKKGSGELTGIFERPTICANDTSAAVGYSPYTDTERLVIATERYINSDKFKREYPETGEDVKVMGYRCGDSLSIIVAIAFIDRYFSDCNRYFSRKEEISGSIRKHLSAMEHSLDAIDVKINTLDDRELGAGGIYLTVLGTSAENGDCGQVGRGNKVNGVISLNRPMCSEAAAGKNPVSHVGKIYSLLARQMAEKINDKVEGLTEVNIRLGSRIGDPIDEPAVVSAQIIVEDGVVLEDASSIIKGVIENELAKINDFTKQLVEEGLPVW